ncbi:hypothetical protein [Terricaulis sp.]|uniref:hypothetical protein n=1 Tax=Terricaulis sp. TaxID=2768686 RepID=UPI002AC54DDE|nr:hypothetical protein [Terricaulis sp.]MDZ4693249.1 hypothetical protein [Terricaulis sp.]
MTSAPSPLAHLWTAARALFDRMRAAIGEAADIAKRDRLPQHELTEARRWLRTLEIMVRRLVLIEASALRRHAHALATRIVRLANLVAPKPAKRASAHRVSFRLWPRQPPHPARIRMLGPPVLVRDIWRDQNRAVQAQRLKAARFIRTPEPQRIASRIEALDRVLSRPERAARRLARRLHVSPATAQRIAAQRPPRHSFADSRLEDEIGARAMRCAHDTS